MASVAAPRPRPSPIIRSRTLPAVQHQLGLNTAHLTLFVLLGLLPFAARADIYGHYTKSPESITAPLDDEVGFFCQTDPKAERVVWRHRPSGSPYNTWKDLPSDEGNTTKLNLSKLTVHLKNESQAGEYRCVSWFWSSALASVVAQLKVARLSVAPSLPDRVLNVAPGANVLIRCPPPAFSEPPPSMIYYILKDGEMRLADGEEVSGAMVVQAGQANKPTVYMCAASNDLTGQIHHYKHHITLTPNNESSGPNFTEDMLESVVGTEGTAVVLTCSAVGQPEPDVTWRRLAGKSLPNRAIIRFNMLHIVDLQVQDGGTYLCVAENNAGRSERAVTLSVWRAPTLEVDDAMSVGGEEGSTGKKIVGEGGRILLQCGTPKGNPTPRLQWFINGDEVARDANIRIIGSSMEINPVEKRHAGMVQCFATNSVGSATTTSLLQVIPRQLSAQGGGIETPIEAIGGGGGFKAGGQGINSKRRNHKANVMIPPSQPNVTRLSDHSVMVRWAVLQNNGLHIQFFKAQYKETPPGKGGARTRWMTANQDIPPHVRSYEVDGLQPGHYYKFRIAAVYSNNDNNFSRNSDKFLLQRGSALPQAPPAPQLPHAEAVSTTDIRLHWELPPTTGEETPVEGFYVYYRPASSAGDYAKAAVEGGDARSLLVAHLMPGSLYELKLQSFAPAIASNFSAIVTAMTLKAPTVEKPPEVKSGGGQSKESDGSGPSFGSSTSGSGGLDNGASTDNNQIITIAGAAVGGAVLLVAVGLVLFYLKRRKDCAPGKPDGSSAAGGGGNAGSGRGERGGGEEMSNGGLPSMAVSLPPHSHTHSHQLLAPSPSPAKPPITITANPLHPEVRMRM